MMDIGITQQSEVIDNLIIFFISLSFCTHLSLSLSLSLFLYLYQSLSLSIYLSLSLSFHI